MKKRNYVVAISLIALLAQTGGLSAMEWGREKVGMAKAATMRAGRWTKEKATKSLDSLYKKAKDFVKEVKTLKRCHKAGDCTPEQYSKIKRMGTGLAATAAAIVLGGGAAWIRAKQKSLQPYNVAEGNSERLLEEIESGDVARIEKELWPASFYTIEGLKKAKKAIKKLYEEGSLSKQEKDKFLKELELRITEKRSQGLTYPS